MNRTLTTLLIAFLIAGVCAYGVFRVASSRINGGGQPVVQVMAAKENTPIGTVLSQANLTTLRIAGTPPKGAILKAENAIGRGVIANLYQGEPILEDRLAAPGSGGGMAATIPAGMRACAVKVDDVVGVAGFVTPGMRVDVLTSGSPSGSGNQSIMASTILQNIEVLSAGTDIQKDDQGKAKPVKVVNLLVTPEQAETLSLASNHLTIQLVLRNPLDTKLNNVPHTSLASLLSEATPPPAVAKSSPVVRAIHKEAPKPFSIEIITGSKRSEITVGVPEGQK
jgi:pilus assembly protein CpaB